MARKLTIHDIACLAGVPKSMLSCMLYDSVNVNPITCERMRCLIAQQDLVPAQTATPLANGNRRFFDMFLLALWSFLAESVQGTGGAFQIKGSAIMLSSKTHGEYFRRMIDRILASIHTHSLWHLITLFRCNLPIVTINTAARRLGMSWASVDNAGGISLGTHHLLSLGPTHLTFLSPHPALSCFPDRYAGHCRARREADIEPGPMLAHADGSLVKCLYEMQALIDLPTASAVGKHYLAVYSILVELEKPGWRFSEDRAVAGFYAVVPLFPGHFMFSTVYQLFYGIGQCAAKMLFCSARSALHDFA